MSTIHNLRAWQSGAAQPRLFDAAPDADEPTADCEMTNQTAPKRNSAEIILFPRASLKALKRPRKKLARRRRSFRA